MMRFKTKLKSSTALIDMTPLVDVIFLLLIFFMITSDILPLKSLNIEQPRLARDSLPLTTQIWVVMDAQNVIYIGSKRDIVDLGSLKSHLEEEMQKYAGANPTIVVSIDKRVEYGDFLRLFATVQECGAKIRLAYQPEEHAQD